ncbi:hypothetical protein CLF_109153 [Clonorchis sinensis]|uniref:Pol-related protein n=1 Tax=Clonorchis sinensis TaxID=79923 RepID=G7YSB0_CLOSI|nr:hypothetical protein CLF_109153 [Clonorchis sinensis]
MSVFQILYGAYVRPLLEYANPVVYSGRTKDVILIERVQRAATKMVAGLKSMDYETRLVVLDLFPLEYRRLRGDLILTYALFEQGLANRFFTVDPANTRRGHGCVRICRPLSSQHACTTGYALEVREYPVLFVFTYLWAQNEHRNGVMQDRHWLHDTVISVRVTNHWMSRSVVLIREVSSCQRDLVDWFYSDKLTRSYDIEAPVFSSEVAVIADVELNFKTLVLMYDVIYEDLALATGIPPEIVQWTSFVELSPTVCITDLDCDNATIDLDRNITDVNRLL